MAHDESFFKVEIFLYDKIFRKEFDVGRPAVNIEKIPIHERNTVDRSSELITYIKKSINRYPGNTVQEYNTLFHDELAPDKWLRYFKDYHLKQTDLPIAESLVEDMYHKLWGVPITMEEAHGTTMPGLEHLHDPNKLYRHNLKTLTRKLLQKTPNLSKQDLEKIIYTQHPIESELLLDYRKKYKHIMN